MTRTLALIAVLAVLSPSLRAADEAPPKVTAAGLLGARARGASYSVEDPVDASGFFYGFKLKSPYGDLNVEGLSLLGERLTEVGALAELDKISKGEVFAKAAGGAVVNVGKGVAAVVKDPGATAKGVGGGIKRMGVNLGRKSKRAAEDAKDAATTTDEEKAKAAAAQPTATPTNEDKAKEAAGSVANSALGVNKAARQWAQKLGVDPYTTNPVLSKALLDFAKIDAAGAIAAKVVVPIPTVATSAASVGNMVWGQDPEALLKLNEGRAKELGVSDAVAKALWKSSAYTLTLKTRLLAALHAVKPEGAASYVETAVEAEDEGDARFFVESAEMMQSMDKAAPAAGVLPDTRALVVRSGGAAIVLLPVDHVRWTDKLAGQAREVAERAKAELKTSRIELRVSGTVSAQAKKELAAIGYVVREGEPLS